MRPSAGSLALVGFQRGKLAAGGSEITVRLLPQVRQRAEGRGSISLQAADWSGTHSYRLDADLSTRDLTIDARQVIDALRLDRTHVGVVATLNGPADKEYLPVELTQDAAPLDVIAVSPIPLRKLRATLIDRGTSQPLQPDIVQTDINERTPIVIPITDAAAGRAAVLKIVSWDFNQDDPAGGLVLSLYVPPAI